MIPFSTDSPPFDSPLSSEDRHTDGDVILTGLTWERKSTCGWLQDTWGTGYGDWKSLHTLYLLFSDDFTKHKSTIFIHWREYFSVSPHIIIHLSGLLIFLFRALTFIQNYLYAPSYTL